MEVNRRELCKRKVDGGKEDVDRFVRGEVLFEFMRASDRAPISCEVRYHGESSGWEVQFLEQDEVFSRRGGFTTCQAAIAWAELERATMEKWGA
jgi:hypothetical protein